MRTTDRDAEFTEFVAAQRSRLMRAARLMAAGDEALAEDLVQTTLTKVYLAWTRCAAPTIRCATPTGC